MNAGYYGKRVAQGDRAAVAHAFLTAIGDHLPLALTRIRLLDVQPEITHLPFEDAAVFTLSVGGQIERDMFLNPGSPPIRTPVPEGSCSFVDLRERARLHIKGPVDAVQFYLPWRTLGRLVDDQGSLHISRLQIKSGDVLADATLGSLAASLIPAFLRPHEANSLFIEHVAHAAGCYIAQRFSTVRERQRRRGGLAGWQENRAKQIIDFRLAGDVSLELLANECGLSTSHFIRAFRNSVGLSPHQWLMRRRIDKALSLMHDHSLSLAQIALACGFADQSHFTRAFTTALGESPGAYRRTNGSAATPRPRF